MPIKIPDQLPAQDVLTGENIFVMNERRAMSQDIRPMELGILNLMPNKIETEIQLLRLLSNTPLQVNVDLIRIDSAVSKHTPQTHMDTFYTEFEHVVDKKYDGLIITGAPLGLLDYEQVTYWQTFKKIIDWSRLNVHSTMFLCWAAHAALYYLHQLPRQLRETKLSGVYPHTVLKPCNPLTRGFDPSFWACHSRVAEVPMSQLQQVPSLEVLASGEQAGAYLIASKNQRQVFITGHPEYDESTLKSEYLRDITAGLNPQIPDNYFANNDPDGDILQRWRAHGNLLLSNWLNYYVYQATPYQLSEIE